MLFTRTTDGVLAADARSVERGAQDRHQSIVGEGLITEEQIGADCMSLASAAAFACQRDKEERCDGNKEEVEEEEARVTHGKPSLLLPSSSSAGGNGCSVCTSVSQSNRANNRAA